MAAAMLIMLLVGIVQVSLGPWLEAGLGLRDLAASRWLSALLGVAAAAALAAQLLLVPRLRNSRSAAFPIAAGVLAAGALMLELAGTWMVSVVGAAIFGFGLGIGLPTCANAVAEGGQAGKALGRLAAAQVLGHAAGAAVGGVLLAAQLDIAPLAPVPMLLASIAFALRSYKK